MKVMHFTGWERPSCLKTRFHSNSPIAGEIDWINGVVVYPQAVSVFEQIVDAGEPFEVLQTVADGDISSLVGGLFLSKAVAEILCSKGGTAPGVTKAEAGGWT